jgi:hypothetical protein
MKYTYSVVRFVPDPVRGEYINVGIIAGSDESSEWQVRTVENLRRARGIDARGILPLVWTFVDGIGRQLDAYADAVEGTQPRHDEISERWLGHLWEDSNNVVQLSEPAPIMAESIESALNTLFEQFVLEPETRRFAFQKKHTALAAIRRAYRDNGLLKGLDFDEASLVKGGHHRERFDFVVTNGHVVQLSQAWSFQVPAQQDLLEKIKAWAWTVEDIRKNGGEAEVQDRKAYVPKDVEVTAVYIPPAPNAPSATLDEALSAFKEVRVFATPANQAARIGETARKRLGR